MTWAVDYGRIFIKGNRLLVDKQFTTALTFLFKLPTYNVMSIFLLQNLYSNPQYILCKWNDSFKIMSWQSIAL